MKYKFNLLLCDFTRRELTRRHTQTSTLMPRVPLSDYFHGRYIDKRPPHLIAAKAFDTHQRPWRTQVILEDVQIQQVLRLIEELDIDPAPNGLIKPSYRGVMTYLLSTFLGAIMHGYLEEKPVFTGN